MKPWVAALQAALYSYWLSAWSIASTMLGTGFSLGPKNGGFDDWPTFVTFMHHAWFGAICGLVLQIGPYVRGNQGYSAAKGGTLPPPEQNQPAK